MLSMSQAASAVGTLGLIVMASLVWWFSNISTEKDALHSQYLDASDEVEAKQRKIREVTEKCNVLKERRQTLQNKRKKRIALAKTESLRTARLATTVGVIRDHMDSHRQLLNFMSYALAAKDEGQMQAELDALGAGFNSSNIVVTSLSEQQNAVQVSGVAVTQSDVVRFANRLKAAGYLQDVKVGTVENKISADQTTYSTFVVSASMQHPGTSQLKNKDAPK